jgi:hypothetical protein
MSHPIDVDAGMTLAIKEVDPMKEKVSLQATEAISSPGQSV